LLNLTTGTANTAVGFESLFSDTTGAANTACGTNTLGSNTAGSFNTALGGGALQDNEGSPALPVYISSGGQLGTIASSERFKKDIAKIEKASEAILSLKPVTFHYKSDAKGIPQFGLIAEEVAKVNPALVLPDKEGKPYTVRYDAVNAMLLNEFLKEHKKVEEQQATIAQLKKDFVATIAQLTARLHEQAAQIQKVSAQLAAASPSGGGLEASKFAIGRIRRGGPAPQVVNNP